jgi:hypothetical protein
METPAIASFEHVSVQERVVGDVRWIAIRARGAEWSWLTPQEAAELAHEWKERYGSATGRN